MSVPQIKARPFELAGCRVFIISGYADDMENYYKENEEMVFYRSLADLIEKIKYFLNHNEERKKIARAGYERTIKEHVYEKRFREIFSIAMAASLSRCSKAAVKTAMSAATAFENSSLAFPN